jgi:hypothetical protein
MHLIDTFSSRLESAPRFDTPLYRDMPGDLGKIRQAAYFEVGRHAPRCVGSSAWT